MRGIDLTRLHKKCIVAFFTFAAVPLCGSVPPQKRSTEHVRRSVRADHRRGAVRRFPRPRRAPTARATVKVRSHCFALRSRGGCRARKRAPAALCSHQLYRGGRRRRPKTHARAFQHPCARRRHPFGAPPPRAAHARHWQRTAPHAAACVRCAGRRRRRKHTKHNPAAPSTV